MRCFSWQISHWVHLLLTLFARRLVFTSNSSHETSSSSQICALSRHLVDIFARRLLILSLTRQLCASTRPRHVLMLTIFTQPLVTLCLIRRHETSFPWQIYTLSRHLVDIFARRPVTLRLFRRHNASFSRQISHWVDLLLTIFTQPLVTLCLIRRHETSFPWQICTSSRHLVDIFARRAVTLRLIRRHETSFSTQLCDRHVFNLPSCWRFLHNDSSSYV